MNKAKDRNKLKPRRKKKYNMDKKQVKERELCPTEQTHKKRTPAVTGCVQLFSLLFYQLFISLTD